MRLRTVRDYTVTLGLNTVARCFKRESLHLNSWGPRDRSINVTYEVTGRAARLCRLWLW